jgi:hypothetical protein
MGSHPLFSFALWRRPGVLTRTLASLVRRSPAYFPVDSLPCRKPPVTVSIRRDPRKGLALHSGARNPVSTGSIATQFDAFASSVLRVGRSRKVTAATAIFSLSARSVRLKRCAVNTKPSPKYFVKLERFEACDQTAAQFSFSPNAQLDLHLPPRAMPSFRACASTFRSRTARRKHRRLPEWYAPGMNAVRHLFRPQHHRGPGHPDPDRSAHLTLRQPASFQLGIRLKL